MPIYVLKRNKSRKEGGMTKKLAERKHARARALERYNIDLTKEMRREIIKNIQSGTGTRIQRVSNTVSLWKNVIPGYPQVPVVYDNKRHEVKTVLREEWVQRPLD